jgi:carbonic anhydrase
MGSSQQSPIDLTNPIYADFGKGELSIKWKKSALGKIKPDEHGVRVEFGGDERQYIELDKKRFHLVQFHFHHPSEHWVTGVQQTMELHVVHQNIDDGTRAVLGIFIEPSGKSKTAPSLISQLQEFFESKGGPRDPSISTNPLDWLPDDVEHYYRYEGSLTTPDYDENVSWAVLRDPLKVPKDELMRLIPYLQHSARLPQALNRRFLLANFKT